MAGVAPRFQQYAGADPLGDVVSWNLKRRQLTTSQKAALAVALKPMFDEQAHERQIELGKTHGDALSANLREGVKGKASEKAAEAVA